MGNAIKIPITLNYSVTCTVIYLNSKVPQISVVDYKASNDGEKKQLPGGKFQAEDLIKSVETFLSKSGKRNASLEHLPFLIKPFAEEYNKRIFEETNYVIQNEAFDRLTEKILSEFQKCATALSEKDFLDILKQTQENTVRHELREEIGASHIGELVLSSVSTSSFGAKELPHYKIGFTAIDVIAPDEFIGSPDSKIEKSYKVDIDEDIIHFIDEIHSGNLQRGILKAIEVFKHPALLNLKRYITAIR